VQGDLNIDDYWCRMKWMADDLCNLDKHMKDRTLVLHILRGLNKKYDHVETYLKRAQPFPSFHNVCNNLLLEELTLDAEASSGSATILAASGGQQQQRSPTPAQQCRPPSSPAPFHGPQPVTPPDIGDDGRGGGGGGSSGRGDGDHSGDRRRRNRCGGTGGTIWMHFLQVESGDLIEYGLIPEFVGRFQTLVSLSSLSEEHLVEVT
jgi:hypothetical protein